MTERRPWRWRVLTLLAGFGLAFLTGILIASWVRSRGDWHDGLPWERALLVRIHTSIPSALDGLMLVFPWFGTNISLIPGVAIVALWLWRRRRRTRDAIQLAVVQLGSYLLNPSLKSLYDRERPALFPRRGWYGWTAYPSGHAIASIAVLLTLCIVLRRTMGWRWPYWVFIPIMLASLYSRLYLGVHWPTDVIGGAAVGAVWLAATIYAFREDESHGRPRS